jgi:hypothetical protein
MPFFHESTIMKVRCRSCDELHDLSDMHIGYERPDAWYAVRPDEREERWEISPDFAALDGERFFLRGLLPIPVHGEAHEYAWGVWAAVDEAHFRRYDERSRDPDRYLEPPFPGRIANQLPAHPLAAEQRGGVYVERVLEMVSPILHGDGPEPRGAPRFATLEAEGWRLLDVEESWRERTGPIWFPDEETQSSVPVGATAKLLWEIVASDTEGRADTHVERMWVNVDHREGQGSETLYSGTLANDPFNPGLTRFGKRVWFTPRHVVDVELAQGEPKASEQADFRCRGHGASFPTYVCTHLWNETDQGFHTADDDPGNPRPDAWCDRCEAMAASEGWTDADIVPACGTCYDIIEDNNRRD